MKNQTLIMIKAFQIWRLADSFLLQINSHLKNLFFSLKIISDNSKEKLDFKNKEEVFSLIYKKITQIDKFIKQILEIEKEDFFNYKLENQIRKITSKYRFSFSQEIKLKKKSYIYAT